MKEDVKRNSKKGNQKNKAKLSVLSAAQNGKKGGPSYGFHVSKQVKEETLRRFLMFF